MGKALGGVEEDLVQLPLHAWDFQLLPELSLGAEDCSSYTVESLAPVAPIFWDQVDLHCGQQVALSPQFCQFTVINCKKSPKWREFTPDGVPRMVLSWGFSVSLAPSWALRTAKLSPKSQALPPGSMG